MAIKLSTTAQASITSGTKVLVYSRAGGGKTALCLSAPNPVIISAEAGLLSLRPENIARMEKSFGRALPRNLPVIEVTSFSDMYEAYRFLTTSIEARQFETICLDSISEIAERLLTSAKGVMKDPRQAYGKMADDMLDLVRAFRDIPGKNVYFSAKLELVKDEATGVTKYGPSMPGRQVGPALPYFFDEVFNLDVGVANGVEYRFFRTRPDFQYDAKDRSGSLAAIERPDLAYVIHKITGA